MKLKHVLGLCLVPFLTGCGLFGGAGTAPAITTVTNRVDSAGKVVEQTTTTTPMVDPQKAAHADGTRALFSE